MHDSEKVEKGSEALGSPHEKYGGEEIEEIIIEGGKRVLQEVRILFKDNKHISLRAELDLSSYGILPRIIADRGHWFKGVGRKKG